MVTFGAEVQKWVYSL